MPGCPGEIDENGSVDAGDIPMVMLGWGPRERQQALD